MGRLDTITAFFTDRDAFFVICDELPVRHKRRTVICSRTARRERSWPLTSPRLHFINLRYLNTGTFFLPFSPPLFASLSTTSIPFFPDDKILSISCHDQPCDWPRKYPISSNRDRNCYVIHPGYAIPSPFAPWFKKAQVFNHRCHRPC